MKPRQDKVTHLRHLHSRHRTDVEAENLRSIVPNHKTLHLPLVYRKIASLDIKVAITREAQHVLTLGVPGHTISIRLLQEKAKAQRKETTSSVQERVQFLFVPVYFYFFSMLALLIVIP